MPWTDDLEEPTLRSAPLLPTAPASVAAGPVARVWELFGFLACLLVAVTLILNIHPVGDGMWFWYAIDLRRGARLYRDLHLPLQPVYPLLTAAFQAVFGTGWLASKIVPLAQAAAFIFFLQRIAAYAPWRPWQRAALVLGSFLLTLRIDITRFDDYHVTANCCFLLSLWVVLDRMLKRGSFSRTAAAVLLGLSCALCTLTRLNDGAALTLCVLLACFITFRRTWWRMAAGIIATMLLTFGAVLLTLRETPYSWFATTVVAARAIKGGGGNVLSSPAHLPLTLLQLSVNWRTPLLLAALACCNWGLYRFANRNGKGPLQWSPAAIGFAVACLASFLWCIRLARAAFTLEITARVISLVLGIAVPVLALLISRWRNRTGSPAWRNLFVALLFPWFHVVGGSLTSANSVPDLYLAMGMLAVLMPTLLSPWIGNSTVAPILTDLLLFAITIVPAKMQVPYQWFTYMDAPVYQDRFWYRHPNYGPMYIERTHFNLIAPMCQTIQREGSSDLLSLPFPYPNYFCGIAPWHGYVQTWYDTSSAATIASLAQELRQAPPRWIVYQRDLRAIRDHELTYRRAASLPQRELDSLIVSKLASRAWTLQQESCLRGSAWLLIETRPVSTASRKNPPTRSNVPITCS